MKTFKKIEAFTISEMVVVLILTSIVVGLGFTVLNLVQKHMVGIQNNFANSTELNKLEQSLWLDFNRYSKIEYNILNEEIKFKNTVDSVSYAFHEDYIIKELDTFQVQVLNIWFYFDGNSIPSGILDAVKLETSKQFQNQKLFIFKKNDATLFVN